jgi:NADP-dependent aldehyde dehydrogenase
MNQEVNLAAKAAAASFREYATSPGSKRAQFLRAIADGIERLGDKLIECVNRETALHAIRIATERARTCMQLRLFADIAEQHAWTGERIDPADPSRNPPKPQVRSRLRPLGPAVVFAASNFPLAFSVAGGDTAAALAVGCPVIVKAHPAHPETSALVGQVIREAAAECRLPGGVFSLLTDSAHETGLAIVQHPLIKVGAFTGSLRGGVALWRAAQQREEPIPFFAEMGSINPVFIYPETLAHAADAIATGLHASMTLGVGQFCTQPGVIFLVEDNVSRAFVDKLAALVSATPVGEMLSTTISENYTRAVEERTKKHGVRILARGESASRDSGIAGHRAGAVLFATDASTFVAHPELAHEVFGPSSLVVFCQSTADYVRCAESLHGQLTATIWADAETGDNSDLLWTLEQKAGRIVFNGFPTGVEVGSAMMHGGPFPATTDSRFTSVGTRSIYRFVRPVAWQTSAA